MSGIKLIRTQKNQNIQPKDDTIMFELGTTSGIIEGVVPTYVGQNKVSISEGRGIYRGQDFIIQEQILSVALSDAGSKTGRIYIQIDLSNQNEPIELLSVVANPLPDLIMDSNFNVVQGIGQMELATYTATELLISNLKATYIAVEGLDVKILETTEEVAANTQKGRLADALVVKEINQSLNGIQFQIVNGKLQFRYPV